MESVYLESSYISYLAARPVRDVVVAARQAISTSWWEKYRKSYDLFISAAVLEEIGEGDAEAAKTRLEIVADIPLVPVSAIAEKIAESLIQQNAVPEQSKIDALHIGIAAAAGIDFLLTWNFKHINNAHTKALIEKAISKNGYVSPVLCSPEELGVEI